MEKSHIVYILILLSINVSAQKSYIKYWTTAAARNSEGVMLRESTAIRSIFTQFRTGTNDVSTSDVYERKTIDSGKTWFDVGFVARTNSQWGYISASAIQSGDSTVVIVGKRTSFDYVRPEITINTGSGWSAPAPISNEVAYYCPANDRLKRLVSGRLILPCFWVSSLTNYYAGEKARTVVYYSDDNGITWIKSASELTEIFPLDEPEVVQLSGGELLMHMRTDQGVVYESRSTDNGTTWSEAAPSSLVSVACPPKLFLLSTGDLIAFHNPNYDSGLPNGGYRTPLRISKSVDGGHSWVEVIDLEDNSDRDFSYVSTYEYDGRLYLSYYEHIRSIDRLSMKFCTLSIDDI